MGNAITYAFADMYPGLGVTTTQDTIPDANDAEVLEDNANIDTISAVKSGTNTSKSGILGAVAIIFVLLLVMGAV